MVLTVHIGGQKGTEAFIRLEFKASYTKSLQVYKVTQATEEPAFAFQDHEPTGFNKL